MAKKNQTNNIDKALESLQGALDIEPVGQEVQLPEQTVEFAPAIAPFIEAEPTAVLCSDLASVQTPHME